jgi:hypothetical protein
MIVLRDVAAMCLCFPSVQNISQKEKGGVPYYEYELSQLDAQVQHTLTVAASKGEVRGGPPQWEAAGSREPGWRQEG